MANILQQAGQGFSEFSWASMGQIVLVISVFVGVLLLFLLVGLFMWWKGFSYNVRIYEPRGQINLTQDEIDKIANEARYGSNKTLMEKNIKFDMIKSKRTHGKYITIKGTPYFQTFLPLRKHEPIPMELMFSDGIHLLRLSREIFIPIAKPNTMISIGENISISVSDNNKWVLWNNIQADRINNKYQDVDLQKRITLYIIVGIVAVVIVGSLVLWFIYSSVNKGWDAADRFNAVADSLVGGSKPI